MAKMGNPGTQTPSVKKEIVQSCLKDMGGLADLEPIRKNDTEGCKKRVRMFFQYCQETGRLPTIELLTAFIARSRQTLHSWEHDERSENGRIIRQTKNLINAILTELSMTNQINSIYAIFLQKCDFGYAEPRSDLTLEVVQKPQYTFEPLPRETFFRELSERYGIDTTEEAEIIELPEPEKPEI